MSDAEIERFENLGAYRFLMPAFWPEGTTTARAPIWTTGAKLNEVQCVLLVLENGAGNEKTKSDLVASRSANGRVTRCDTQTLSLPFAGYRFDRGGEIELLYMMEAHGDLLTAGCIFAPHCEADANKLASLLLTMVSGAVVRRGSPALSSTPKQASGNGFFKRLFGG